MMLLTWQKFSASWEKYSWNENWKQFSNETFKVLIATGIKMFVFWDVAPCSLIDYAFKYLGNTP
jgi:hypothetical protein